ncbi:UNVERIFIED_CONTAM: hypothetical protein PYX00_009461 [Menopon gallinae]|uniref:Uncharacterized protein n=1 Tax=Menopon gallinae TaxID=328185 RepID=A0AAW2HBF2_9NEOP
MVLSVSGTSGQLIQQLRWSVVRQTAKAQCNVCPDPRLRSRGYPAAAAEVEEVQPEELLKHSEHRSLSPQQQDVPTAS